MGPQDVIDLLQEAFKIGLSLSLPIMLAALMVGVAVSVVQSITSIQEQTMVFVPKILAVLLAMLVCFSWMMNTLMGYTRELFESIPNFMK